jgi:hypothetical protein
MVSLMPQPDFHCNDCGRDLYEEDTYRGSLDAYADLSVDYDTFCRFCDSEDLEVLNDND